VNYTGSVPDTTSPDGDWRSAAACLDEDSELFFPKGADGPWLLVIEEAKTVCRTCPVASTCLQFALDEDIPSGIFGGLTERERAGLLRSVRRGRTALEDVTAKAQEAREPRQERTLQTIFDDNTTRLCGGHLAWTPRQVAFIADRGRRPEGPVLADCGSKDCVLPAHLTDQPERGYCGTRNGYKRHRANGEEACAPCRKANTDADNRLRRTGTTKKLTGNRAAA